MAAQSAPAKKAANNQSAEVRSSHFSPPSSFEQAAKKSRILLERRIRDQARRSFIIAGAMGIVFEAVLALVDSHARLALAGSLLAVHALGGAVALAALLMVRLAAFERRWQGLALGLLLALMAVATVGQISLDEFAGFDLTLLMCVMGGSVLFPWSGRWQAAVNVAAILCLSVADSIVHRPFEQRAYLWIALLGAAGLSQLNTVYAWRYWWGAFGKLKGLGKSGWGGASPKADLWLLSHSLEGLVSTLNEQGVICSLSPWAVSTLGYAPEELIGVKVHDLIHPDDLERARQAFIHALRTPGDAAFTEFRFRHKNGSWRELESALQTTRDVLWNKMLLVFARDITERRQAERRLAESEARFREIFETSLDAILIVRLCDQRILDANPAFAALSGFAREQTRGWTPLQLNLWADLEQREAFYADLETKGFSHNRQFLLCSKSARRAPVLCSAVKAQWEGEPCVIAILHDITHIKRVEAELRSSEAKFKQVFDSSLDAIVITNFEDGKFIEVNDEFLRETGLTREQALGKTAGELQLWLDPQERAPFVEKLHAEGRVRNFEAAFRTKDDGVAQHLLNATVVEAGGERRVILVSRDISQLKRAEHELIETRERALAASKAKSEFLSSMSHEIRTPLNAILGTTELLAESPLSAEQRRHLSVLRANGGALLDLINDVLDLAKIESRSLSLEQINFDLEEAAETVMRALALRAHEKNLELVAHVVAGTPVRLRGDPSRLRQVLTNLIGNAIKFTEHGEVVLSVARDPLSGAAGMLRFAVSDTGIGIPQDKLDDIFRTFTQADSSTTRKYGGSGLELAISRHLVKAMGGHIWVRSELGKGSVFYFTANFELQPASAPAGPSVEPALSGAANVLLAGSSSSCALAVSETLSALGVKVHTVQDSAQALAELSNGVRQGQPYLFALLDAQQMGRAAFDLARQIKRHLGAGQRVALMLASHNLAAELPEARELGLDVCLVKPISPTELSQAVRAALAGTEPAATPACKPAPSSWNGADPLRILVAEDSSDNRLVIETFLKDLPHQVDVAEDGDAALKRFMAADYDLVLMDMQMPVMDGYTATRMIRKWERDHNRRPCRILALTAYALRNEMEKSLAAGCDGHLTKPISKATLREAVNESAAQLSGAGSRRAPGTAAPRVFARGGV
jgi:PAS domain S-box-containing protein